MLGGCLLETAPQAVAVARPSRDPQPPSSIAVTSTSPATPAPAAVVVPAAPIPSVELPPPPTVVELPPPKETIVTEKVAAGESRATGPQATSAVFVSTAAIAPVEAVPLRGGVALRTGKHADQQLRSVIMAHEADMQKCVERQLKLMPDMKAEGTLVVEVDAKGRVPAVALQGASLGGSPLELCLRKVSQRWRFPRTGRPYSVEAPVKVRGR